MKSSIIRASLAASIIIAACFSATLGHAQDQPTEVLAKRVVVDLTASYESGDISQFMTLVSSQYLEGYEDLQSALEDRFSSSVSVQLIITPERIWVDENNKVFMDAGWDKTITINDTAETQKTSGRVTFIFIKYEPDVLKLFSQKGNPVFP